MEAYCYNRYNEKRKIWRHIVIIDTVKRERYGGILL